MRCAVVKLDSNLEPPGYIVRLVDGDRALLDALYGTDSAAAEMASLVVPYAAFTPEAFRAHALEVVRAARLETGSLDERTHICVVDREGSTVLETRTATLPEAIAAALARAPSCQRVVLETGRMAPTLCHGLTALGVPVVCIESRQAYRALKSLATHRTDRNDARGLAQLARSGFFKSVHVKSLPAHAVRALILARKKLVGQRVTLENQIRGLAVVFGIRLPRGLSPAFAGRVASAGQDVAGRSVAWAGLLVARNAVLEAITAIDRDMKRLAHSSEACRRLMTIPAFMAAAFAASASSTRSRSPAGTPSPSSRLCAATA